MRRRTPFLLIGAALALLSGCAPANDPSAELGSLAYAGGATYIGAVKDGKPNGQGTYTYPSGAIYIGELRNGRRHGQGTYFFPGGAKYTGTFNDDVFDGQGTYTFADGARYIGGFKSGQRSGQGTAIFRDGSKYVGEFKDGHRNGPGAEYGITGELLRSGTWQNDQFAETAAPPPATPAPAAEAPKPAPVAPPPPQAAPAPAPAPVAATPPPPTTTPSESPAGALILGAMRSQDRAQKLLTDSLARAPDLAAYPARVVDQTTGDQHFWFAILTLPPTTAPATLCATLKSRSIDCSVASARFLRALSPQ